MDPITVLTTASGLVSSASALYQTLSDLVRDAKEVDSTVQQLVTDVRNVQRVVQSIKEHARTASEDRAMFVGNELWTWVEEALRGCSETLDSMGAELAAVGIGPSRNAWSKATRAMRLNERSDKINDLSKRVQWNQNSLQMVLDMIIIRTIQTQGRSSEESLDQLHDRMQELKHDLQHFTDFVNLFKPSDPTSSTYQKRAKSILSSAKSDFDVWSAASEAATVPPDEARHRSVEDWRAKLPDLPIDSPVPGVNKRDSGLGSSSTSLRRRIGPAHACIKMFSKADDLYIQGSYAQALAHYEETLELLRKHPNIQDPPIDRTTLQLYIAVTKIRLASATEERQRAKNTYQRIVTPTFLNGLKNESGPLTTEKQRRQFLVAEYCFLIEDWRESEYWYQMALDNDEDERVHEYHFSSAEVSWLMIQHFHGKTLLATAMLEDVESFVKHRFDTFAKLHKTIPSPEHLVLPAIETHDFQMLFLALNRARSSSNFWNLTQATYAKIWLMAAIKAGPPIMFKLLLLHDVDVNITWSFKPNYSFKHKNLLYAVLPGLPAEGSESSATTRRFTVRDFTITPLMIAIGQSAGNEDMVKIALMCIENFKPEDASTAITALHLAASVDNTRIIEALLAKGADINAKARLLDDGPRDTWKRQRGDLHTPTDVATWRGARQATQVLKTMGGGGVGISTHDDQLVTAVYTGLCAKTVFEMTY